MRLLLFLILGLVIIGCRGTDRLDEVSKDTMIYVGDTIVNDYAQAFRIIEHESFVQVDIIDPDIDSVLYQYGIGEYVPKRFIKLKSEIEKIAALSSTHVGMIRELGLEEHILGVSDSKYLCDTIGASEWIDFGELGQADPELYLSNNPDLIMYSGFKLDVPILKKLKQMGVSSMVNYDWKETHPLGRAEWLKVFGLLFREEKRSTEIFDKIKMEYLNIAKFIRNAPSSPTVLVGTIYGDIFNVPGGDSYMAQMLDDANVNYVYSSSNGTGSLNLSLEKVIISNRSTDYWINVAANSNQEILNMNENFKMLESFKNDQVYSYFYDVNCFWEGSAAAPQKVLSDLIHIFHPDQLERSKLNYYRRVK